MATYTVINLNDDGAGSLRAALALQPAPAERLYQVFTVEDGQVIEIRGYPDRARARARP